MIPAIPSLRNRFFLVLGLISVATLLAMGWAVRYQVTPELLKNEDEFANRVLDRAERSIAHELGHLSLMAEDWARRGNAYDFAREEQHRDIDSRLHEETLVALDLQLVAFFAEDGQPQWVSGFNPESGVFSSCPGLAAECHWAVGTVAMLQRTLQGSLPEQTHGWCADSPGLLQRLVGSDQAQFGTFGGKRCVGMQLEAGNVVLAADDQAWARGECGQCRGTHQYIAIALSLDAKAEIIAAPLL